MTNPPQPKKSAEDHPAATQTPESPQEKHKGKKSGDKGDDLRKIIWNRIGPLTIDPLE